MLAKASPTNLLSLVIPLFKKLTLNTHILLVKKKTNKSGKLFIWTIPNRLFFINVDEV